MTTLLLCGKSDDNSIGKKLLEILEDYGGVQSYDGINLTNPKNNSQPAFLLYDCERLPHVDLEKGILLFKNSFCSEKEQKIPSGFIPVFESRNIRAAAALKGTGIVGVTCGTSAKDILSIASLDEASAIVSLQRSVKTLTGEVIEPHDITIQLKNAVSPFQLLIACSVLLLSGVPVNCKYCF